MKKWTNPKLMVLGVDSTLETPTPYHDPSVGHLCHKNPTDTCINFTDGSHNSMGYPHTEPTWYSNGHHDIGHEDSDPSVLEGHTCCCYGLS